MDKINQEILSQLLITPQKPFLKISEELGISSITVKDRYEKMKKDGIIIGNTIMLNLSKIGYQGKAFIHITTSDNNNPEIIIKALEQIPNVFLVSRIIGEFDLLVMVVFRDLTELKDVINRIRAQPSVSKVETSITDDTMYPVTREYSQLRLF